jgi:N-acetylmuramoyl-L-alanine amidase
MNFKQCNSTNYKSGRTDNIKYIVIHYTANNGDTAKNNIDYYANNSNLSASAHYFVDENAIWQSVKDTDTAWHCGAKAYKHPYCRNANSIGIELCSRKDSSGNYYFKDETIRNAVELTKTLMVKYNIPATNIIRHYDVTGKICPAPMVNNASLWDSFKNMISAPVKKLETGNDIVWELMNGKYKVEINEVQRAVEAVDKAKDSSEFYSLYWILYKLVNENG